MPQWNPDPEEGFRAVTYACARFSGGPRSHHSLRERDWMSHRTRRLSLASHRIGVQRGDSSGIHAVADVAARGESGWQLHTAWTPGW